MDKFVPPDILKQIERIEIRKGEKYRAGKNARLAERDRQRQIEALRQGRKAELVAACKRIEAWIERFNDDIGPSFWELLGPDGSVTLYIGKFWRGEPAPVNDVTCSARLRFGGPDTSFTEALVYEELHKGSVSYKQTLLSAHMLWQRLHPDFVLQCDAHLSGPDAWKHIRQRLEQIEYPAGKLTSAP